MSRSIRLACTVLLLSLLSFGDRPAIAAAQGAIDWLRSDSTAFERARQQHRFVILYLEAVWCHWCHVMDEKTYGDSAVRAEIAAHYVPLRIDQDLRPDLANRYRDYGWPATIVFAADGSEIVKRQGFIEPERFLRLLKAIEADPSPEAAAVDAAAATQAQGALAEPTRSELIKRHRDTFDARLGGLDIEQKYLDRDSVEYALVRTQASDADEKNQALKTLDAARALVDPVWGGVYQYSTHQDWRHPHYEKLATVQAQSLRIHALAYALLGSDADRTTARQIQNYIDRFLTAPEGAFYVSQDADLHPGEHSDRYFALDDAARRKLGIPRVDTHVYALQNGQIVEALATWAELGGDADAVVKARRAAEWIVAHRALAGGGFRHDESDAAGPYLGDTLAMGRAFLALYRATAERAWLARATAALDFIDAHFRTAHGYVSAQGNGPIAATAQVEENISLARFANLLARYTGSERGADAAKTAMGFLAQPSVALGTITEPGILLADDELGRDPLHLTVVGGKQDEAARRLFSALQRLPSWYKRIEWWDRSEGALPNPDVTYPAPKHAAAFVCTQNRCSLPLYQPEDIAAFLALPNR